MRALIGHPHHYHCDPDYHDDDDNCQDDDLDGNHDGKGSRLIPNRMFFYTMCKWPLPLPPPSVSHNHVADFSDR